MPLILVFFFLAISVHAQNNPIREAPPELVSQSAVVMDATTGAYVFLKNPNEVIPPASLTKLMTMHLVLTEFAAGRAEPDEPVTLPRETWAVNQLPSSSLMHLANGQTPSLKDLLLGMAVSSGNDAAMAAALHLAPSVEDFVGMMNREAENLGLMQTRFVDPSGYWEFNLTTAREFADFCRFYIDAHPESLREYHSVREFRYPRAENVPAQYQANPGTRIRQNNNNLLGRVRGVDGLKTGYIPESGYNIALTAERDDTRFIAVILGAPAGWGGDRIRDNEGEKLLNWAFNSYRTIRPRPEIPEPVRIWKGKQDFFEIAWDEPLDFTASSERGEDLIWEIELSEPYIAPLPAGSHAGDVVLYDSLGELRRIPLITVSETERGGFFKRLFDSIRLYFLQRKK